jgi:hypothetical protein
MGARRSRDGRQAIAGWAPVMAGGVRWRTLLVRRDTGEYRGARRPRDGSPAGVPVSTKVGQFQLLIRPGEFRRALQYMVHLASDTETVEEHAAQGKGDTGAHVDLGAVGAGPDPDVGPLEPVRLDLYRAVIVWTRRHTGRDAVAGTQVIAKHRTHLCDGDV